MRFWSPVEVCKILDVTSRQITDFAEQGIVTPAKDTAGQGIPRFYDFKGLLEIAVAASLRRVLSSHHVKTVMEMFRKAVKEAEQGLIDPWDLLIIKFAATGRTLEIRTTTFNDFEGEDLRWNLDLVPGRCDPDDHRSLVINVTDLRRDLELAIKGA
jgi:DNA-binding transcriptional MerR regulator